MSDILLEPPGDEESYLPEGSRNSSAIESFCVNAPFLITVSLGGHYRRKRGGRQVYRRGYNGLRRVDSSI